MRAAIFSTLYGSVIFFATSIFQCEMVKLKSFYRKIINQRKSHVLQNIPKMNAELAVGFSGLWMSIACMYVYSDFATKVTTQIQAIGYEMYDKNWNLYPMEYRLFVQLTISRSQRPLYFHGFGLINCDMVTFSKVETSCGFYIEIKCIFIGWIYSFLACQFGCFVLSYVQAYAIKWFKLKQTIPLFTPLFMLTQTQYQLWKYQTWECMYFSLNFEQLFIVASNSKVKLCLLSFSFSSTLLAWWWWNVTLKLVCF